MWAVSKHPFLLRRLIIYCGSSHVAFQSFKMWSCWPWNVKKLERSGSRIDYFIGSCNHGYMLYFPPPPFLVCLCVPLTQNKIKTSSFNLLETQEKYKCPEGAHETMSYSQVFWITVADSQIPYLWNQKSFCSLTTAHVLWQLVIHFMTTGHTMKHPVLSINSQFYERKTFSVGFKEISSPLAHNSHWYTIRKSTQMLMIQ